MCRVNEEEWCSENDIHSTSFANTIGNMALRKIQDEVDCRMWFETPGNCEKLHVIDVQS